MRENETERRFKVIAVSLCVLVSLIVMDIVARLVILPRLDVQESAVRDFCSTESIEFISLAEPLRRTIAEGAQAYFTYDEHWTPLGHKIVAETISQYIQTAGKASNQ